MGNNLLNLVLAFAVALLLISCANATGFEASVLGLMFLIACTQMDISRAVQKMGK